jgi:hypothetical protein
MVEWCLAGERRRSSDATISRELTRDVNAGLRSEKSDLWHNQPRRGHHRRNSVWGRHPGSVAPACFVCHHLTLYSIQFANNELERMWKEAVVADFEVPDLP